MASRLNAFSLWRITGSVQVFSWSLFRVINRHCWYWYRFCGTGSPCRVNTIFAVVCRYSFSSRMLFRHFSLVARSIPVLRFPLRVVGPRHWTLNTFAIDWYRIHFWTLHSSLKARCSLWSRQHCGGGFAGRHLSTVKLVKETKCFVVFVKVFIV